MFDITAIDYNYRTYGKAMLAIYTLLSALLLANLLIAIITNR